MNRWKGLTALVIAGALVVAPMVTAGAVADEPPDDTAVVAVEPAVEPEAVEPTEPVVAEPVEPVVVEEPAVVAEPVAEPEPEPVVEPEEPVVAEPVEPATEPVTPVTDPVTPVTDPETTYILALWKAEPGTEWPQTLVSFTRTTSTSLDQLDAWADEDCTFYQVDLYADDATTASLLAGGVLTGPNNPAESFPDIYGPKWKQFTTTCPPPPPTPPVVTIVPDCENELGNILVTVVSDNEADVQVTLYLDFNGDGIPDASEVLTVVPGTTVLHYTFAEDVTVGIQVSFEGVPIFQDYVTADCEPNILPEPALFAADPVPPTCDTDGALPDFEEEFPNVSWFWDREFDGIGTYTLTVVPDAGYAFDPVNITEPWTLNEDGSITREVTVDGALGFQGEDPNLPCYLAPPLETTLGQPSIVDECGTVNDFGYTPDDTATVTYEWVDATDDSNWDIWAYVADGYTVTGDTTGWEQVPDENIWLYSWDPLPVFTDEPCDDGENPPPPVPPTKGDNPPVPPLAATGNGVDYTGWVWGAIAGVLAGLGAVIGSRKLARR